MQRIARGDVMLIQRERARECVHIVRTYMVMLARPEFSKLLLARHIV